MNYISLREIVYFSRRKFFSHSAKLQLILANKRKKEYAIL